MSQVKSLTGKAPVIICVIPAAGVGKRMRIDHPKQYLTINDKTILQHTVERMQALPFVQKVVIAISPEDQYFQSVELTGDVCVVNGGAERVDSVLAGLLSLEQDENCWVLVHDAARPNVCSEDVEKLVATCLEQGCGGILAVPVRDTMKRGGQFIDHTESRDGLWHALTPQFFPLTELVEALQVGLDKGVNITDEASAVESLGKPVLLVEGRSDNLKITRPEDLALAEFYLKQSL